MADLHRIYITPLYILSVLLDARCNLQCTLVGPSYIWKSYILGMYFLKAMANREDFAKSGMLRRNARIGYCFALVRQHIDIVWIAMSM